MFDLAEKLDPGKQQAQKIQAIRSALLDEDSNWRRLTENLFQEVDKRVIRKLMESFMINANLFGLSRKHALEEKYDCNIPWAILMDPTSACNLSCIGCWAGRYEKKNNLSYETLDSICRQGKELGVHFYIFSGGEPLVRRKDIIRLCEAHQDCYFFAFTNGTLVDDELCREMLRVGNFALAFSIEGDEEATDMRRGKGTYRKVIAAMERMKEYGLLFGCSTCYHRYNTESIASDEFVDDMIARGCRFMWNFTYMPVGREARTDFLATPSSGRTCTAASGKSGRPSPSLPLISGMTASIPAAALPAGGSTCISTPPVTWSPVPSFTTPTSTFTRYRCWRRCARRSLWLTAAGSLSTTTTCGPARCWTIRKPWPPW